MNIKRFRLLSYIFITTLIIIVISLAILYGYLISYYTEHALYIMMIFTMLITSFIYLYDIFKTHFQKRIIGKSIKLITPSNPKFRLPEKVFIDSVPQKADSSYIRYQGMKIPFSFIETIKGDFGYLYPFLTSHNQQYQECKILAHYLYKFYLIETKDYVKLIVCHNQVA
jgi:hypothetical protein